MQWSDRLNELEVAPDPAFPTLSRAERLIRWILLTGFVLVLLVEGWLVWQLLRMLP